MTAKAFDIQLKSGLWVASPNRSDWSGLAITCNELDRNRIHTVACILLGQVLALENVAQMAVAVVAQYFHAIPISIHFTPNRASNLIIEGWPTAVGLEFVI